MGRDLSGFRAPFLKKETIREKADRFRDEHWEAPPPIDIEQLVEFDLGLLVIPLSDLRTNTDCECFLSTDCKAIRVDAALYSNPNYVLRLRFSLAHEIGHLVLHKDVLPAIRPASIEEWYDIQKTMPPKEYNYLELHAYEFAGRFLVPRKHLLEEVSRFGKELQELAERYPEIEEDLVAAYIAPHVSKKFQVSEDVVSRRIRFEGILYELGICRACD